MSRDGFHASDGPSAPAERPCHVTAPGWFVPASVTTFRADWSFTFGNASEIVPSAWAATSNDTFPTFPFPPPTANGDSTRSAPSASVRFTPLTRTFWDREPSTSKYISFM